MKVEEIQTRAMTNFRYCVRQAGYHKEKEDFKTMNYFQAGYHFLWGVLQDLGIEEDIIEHAYCEEMTAGERRAYDESDA